MYELNLDVPRGCVFAFLGRNGSGKTTTIRMLMGLLSPTRGGGRGARPGHPGAAPETRARIGYLTEEHPLYGWMNVRESGEFQSRFYPRWNDQVYRGVVGHFGLKPAARVKDLSRGERAGLCLALTLAPEPELLVLDDPGLGLDPVARRALVESMIFLTRKSDRTIFFSSHHYRTWNGWRITWRCLTGAFCARAARWSDSGERAANAVAVCGPAAADAERCPACYKPFAWKMNCG